MTLLSRREFIGRAAFTAAALTLPIDLRRAAASPLGTPDPPACAILPLDDTDSLRESVAGFESALRDAKIPFGRSRWERDTAVVIVPAVVRIPPRVSRQLTKALDDGATVIVESGAVFASAQSRDLREHREVLRHAFGIEIDSPASLWPARGIPYIEYTWPVAVRVRDFSRVVPVARHDGEVIGRAAGQAVAVHRCQGRGTLIFLGSPIGPALWSGDAEAGRWVRALLSGLFDPGRSGHEAPPPVARPRPDR